MDSLGNVNHTISIVGHWIFDSNHEKSFCLTQESLVIIFYPYIGEELIATFQSVSYFVRYSCAPGKPKKEKHDTVK